MARSKPDRRTGSLFRNMSGQDEMFEKSYEEELEARRSQPVDCLGLTFESHEKRREFFVEKLRQKLKDPEFRKIDGFPIGEDEDILSLSDPPYYTACPNPFVEDFIKNYGKPYDPATDDYQRKPFAADVKEGKNDPIYNAHSYHTKVPHKAIMRYILHYTQPGDIVFDGFCGTGMTGVASQLCGDSNSLAALGFNHKSDNELFDKNENSIGRKGGRRTILNDLSPAATLICAGYNLTADAESFSKLATALLEKFNDKYGWMYQTTDPGTGDVCDIDFTIWSEIFICPHCLGELEFWALAYERSSGRIVENPTCPQCAAEVSKRDLIRRVTTYFDKVVGATRTKQILKPVEIHYRHQGMKKTKFPNEEDLEVLAKIEQRLEEIEYPTELMMFTPEGREWGDLYRGYHEGINRVHDFHLVRQLVVFSILWHSADDLPSEEAKRLWRFTLQSIVVSFTRRNRFLKNAYSQVNRSLSGTLYIGSTVSEPSPTYVLTGKLKRFKKAIPSSKRETVVTTQSLASALLPENSVDYVFIDPPFGDNLPYAELNFLWEAWLRVFTHAGQDAIVSKKWKKTLNVYTNMMSACLRQVYRMLKPNRWITVEFHNSKNSVWTAIQEALGQAGFIIADVRILDKGMLTKKQLNANAVNKDLVISAYKPNGGLEDRFKLIAGTENGVWDFVRTHLKQLPVFVSNNGQAEAIAERQNYLLFDRMVAFHVQRGVTVPLSAAEFYAGLEQRFPSREGMYFLPEQAAEYDKKRMTVKEVLQIELFVSDEASAIQWLKQLLTRKPQTFQEIHPQFLREIGGWRKHEKLPELSEMLEQNFLRYDGAGEVPSQIHSYLSTNFKELRNRPKDDWALKAKAKNRWYVPDPNKTGDLERLRESALLKEFEEYREPRQRRLKVFRLEAVRAGFKKAWQERNYKTIISVAQKIPDNILHEDPKLLMWYDQALTRTGGES